MVCADSEKPVAGTGDGSDAKGPFAHERRRPGRLEYSNPELVQLLRGSSSLQAGAPAESDSPENEEESLRAMSGILVAVLIGASFWTVMAAAIWMWA